MRTIQNWETGGARIPWMAFRMLRILIGYALPGTAWEGWTVHGDRLIAPNGRWYEANTLVQIEHIFGMARLWHRDYKARNLKHHAGKSEVCLTITSPINILTILLMWTVYIYITGQSIKVKVPSK